MKLQDVIATISEQTMSVNDATKAINDLRMSMYKATENLKRCKRCKHLFCECGKVYQCGYCSNWVKDYGLYEALIDYHYDDHSESCTIRHSYEIARDSY